MTTRVEAAARIEFSIRGAQLAKAALEIMDFESPELVVMVLEDLLQQIVQFKSALRAKGLLE